MDALIKLALDRVNEAVCKIPDPITSASKPEIIRCIKALDILIAALETFPSDNTIACQRERYNELVAKFGQYAMDQARKRCREECSRISWRKRCSNLPIDEDGSFCHEFIQRKHWHLMR